MSSVCARIVIRFLLLLLVWTVASPAWAQLTGEDQSCINTMNKAAMNVAKAQGKENSDCVRSAVKGKEPDPENCIVADERGKVLKAEEKTIAADMKRCGIAPAVGYAGASAANDAAKNEESALVADLFGLDIHGTLLNSVGGSSEASCQAGVSTNLEKVFKTALKSFRLCKKRDLKSGAIVDTTGLEACLDAVAADPKVLKTIDKMSAKFNGQCVGLDLAALFPGACFGALNQPACFGGLVRCRTCRMLNVMDAMSANCDLFDDGLPNASCIVVAPTTTSTTTTLP